MRFPAILDRPVAAALRGLSPSGGGLVALPSGHAGDRPRELFARAELHGVAGVIWDAWKASGRAIDPELATKLETSALARELDHEAHLALLRKIDGALDVPAIALKGPLFARRYYPRPSARATTDIDLLVAEVDLERAITTLATIGYAVADDADEIARARREHHHLHLVRPQSPDLELHFHAYRGFGMTLRTEMLAERSSLAEGFRTLRVASAPDEIVYLAAHAAAHRFMRLAWLHDVKLVAERMSAEERAAAAARARAWGFSRVLSLAGELVVDVLGVAPEIVAPFGSLPPATRAIVHAVVAEPEARVLSAATRFAYTAMLADTPSASLRYVRHSSFGHARRILGLT